MTRRNTIPPEDAEAMAHEDRRDRQSNIEEGMCKRCGDRPINPALEHNTCLECKHDAHATCSKGECPKVPVACLGQQRFCEPHLIEETHHHYENYLAERSKVEELREEYDKFLQRADMLEDEIANRENVVEETWQEHVTIKSKIHQREQAAQAMKRRIERAMEEVNQVFHENFDLSI